MERAGNTAERLVEGNYEGDTDVLLAPVSGVDDRRELRHRRELFVKRPDIFLGKFCLAIGLIVGGWVTVSMVDSWLAIVAAMLVNGLMYAHLIELQHECLHGHAFSSPALNRLFGVLCGIFMLSPHSHYRYDHLRHHAHLGTDRNKEHFDYRFQDLDSPLGFARSFFDLSRYRRVARWIGLSMLWRHLPNIDKPNYDRDIKQEYLLYFVLLLGSIGWTAYSGSAPAGIRQREH